MASVKMVNTNNIKRDLKSDQPGGRVDKIRDHNVIRSAEFPVWVRAPKRGVEFYTGTSRAKLYQWAAKGYIRSVSIREGEKRKGTRFFHLQSLLEFIARHEKEAQ